MTTQPSPTSKPPSRHSAMNSTASNLLWTKPKPGKNSKPSPTTTRKKSPSRKRRIKLVQFNLYFAQAEFVNFHFNLQIDRQFQIAPPLPPFRVGASKGHS